MKKWQVSVIGAFDRFNYGDVLFAKVVEHMCNQHLAQIDFEFFGLQENDLTADGGVVAQRLSKLYRRRTPQDARHLVILAGGEILGPTWAQMAEYLVSPALSKKLKWMHMKTRHARWTGFWRRVYGCPNLQPWTIDPDDLPDRERVHVVYNAVGGSKTRFLSKAQLAWQSRALQKADWISVRDKRVADGVVARGLEAPLVVPDSAVIMKDMISDTEIEQARQQILKLSGLPEGPYICVQAAEHWAQGRDDQLADALKAIHEATGFNVVSFTIGRIAGHSDQVTSHWLQDRLRGETWFGVVDTPLTVKQTMGLIAASQCYLGTSLHGFITAFAFARPRVGLKPLPKLVGFRDDWDLKDMPIVTEFTDIPEAASHALAANENDMRQKALVASQTYQASFAEMIAKLQR